MEMIKDIMDTETSTLLLFDEDKNELVFKVALASGDELKEKEIQGETRAGDSRLGGVEQEKSSGE